MLGLILVWKLDESNAKGRLAGLALGSVSGVNVPLALSLISSNVAGFTKRSVTSALLFIVYCVANIVSPQFFLEREEPRYGVGNNSLVFSSVSGWTNGYGRPEWQLRWVDWQRVFCS